METMPVEGSRVWNSGHEFIATDVRLVVIDGRHVAYYTGVCTDNPCNDSIRHTGYNGGHYSKFLGYQAPRTWATYWDERDASGKGVR